MKRMNPKIQESLRKQPKTTKDRPRVARKVTTPAAAKDSGHKAPKPAASKGNKE